MQPMHRAAQACQCAFFFQAEDGIRDKLVTGVQTCALPILPPARRSFTGLSSNVTANFSAKRLGFGTGDLNPLGIARGDLNGDGKLDVAVATTKIGRASCRERV